MSCVACILEKAIYRRMISFCEEFQLLSDAQHGFRTGRSTITLLEDFADGVNEAIDGNNIALRFIIDLEKAFDTIDHSIIINKLSLIGFRGIYTNLFKDYFEDRYQLVTINSTNSNRLHLRYGVPQGSILGPLLFNVYVNDISDVKLHSKIYQYADDTALVLAGKNVSEGVALLQEDINKLIPWFQDNHIYINKDKTQLICFHSPHRKVELHAPLYLHNNLCRNCKCASVNFSTKVKYLRLIFDETFS